MYVFRYIYLQLILILCCGFCTALAIVCLPTTAVLFLILSSVLTYLLAHYIAYSTSANTWRDQASRILTKLLRILKAPPRLTAQRSALVHKEAQKLIQLILKDFILSWYNEVSFDKELPREASRLLEHIALELQSRLQVINVDNSISLILPLLEPYITALNEVGFVNERGNLTFDVNHPNCLVLFEKKSHLIHHALQNEQTEIEYLQKLADAFIACSVPSYYKNCDVAGRFIREVLIYRVFQPLLTLLCEPDFLLKVIPLILAKLTNEKVKHTMDTIAEENRILEEHLQSPEGLLTPYLVSLENSRYSSAYHESSSLLMQRLHYPWPIEHSDIRYSSSLPQPIESDDGETVNVPLPSIYITRYVSVDSGDGVHTGYIIKFPETMISDDAEAGTEVEALKRYREFAQLQKSLLISSLGVHVKKFTLPDRKIFSHIWSKVPFIVTEPNPTIILERQEGLQTYLQNLSSIKEVRESHLFKEFLRSGVEFLHTAQIAKNQQPRKWTIKSRSATSINNKTVQRFHYIEDVLSTFIENQLPIVPHRTLLSAVDTSLSTEQIDSQTVASATNTNTQDVTNNGSTEGFKNLFQLLIKTIMSFLSYGSSEDANMILAKECERRSPLINRLLSLANEATRTTCPELWITSESTQLAILGLTGQTLDAMMIKELHEVINDETRWARSLFNLRHLLWPNGHLSVSNQVTVSENEKVELRKTAIHEIKNFLPNAIPYLIGSAGYNDTIEHCLDCIQNSKINKHFLFHVIDILFVQVVPEFNDESFKEKLTKLRTKPIFVQKINVF